MTAPHPGGSDSPTGRGSGRLARMVGRDPDEPGRATSSLELLFDLAFVVAVGTAAAQFAEILVEGHVLAAVAAFVVAMFAISVAWINFCWFASAFDTDDWLYRVLTMLQMVGVVVFALGLPRMFQSLEVSHRLDIRTIVAGYVVMRVAMVLQWGRAARQSPQFAKVGRANVLWTVVAQLGWVIVAFLQPPLPVIGAAIVLLGALELLVPVLTQGSASGTPWHPHHVADRYSGFAIIVLGEGVVGTVASSAGLIGEGARIHWTVDAVVVVVAGIGLTFGMWWAYFVIPFGDILERRRSRGYLFGYGHMPLFAGIAATGAGLHVAGMQLEDPEEVSELTVVLALAVPVAVFLFMGYLLHTLLLRPDRFHLLLIGVTLAVLAVAVALSASGAQLTVCLLVVMLAPFVTVVGYETVGRRHQEEMLESLQPE